MFALLALICFVLKVFDVGVVDLLALGLAFMAAHLLFGPWPFGAIPWHRA